MLFKFYKIEPYTEFWWSKSGQSHLFNKNHDLFWHSYCGWCDLCWIFYLGCCEISIPSYRTPMLKMKVNEKNPDISHSTSQMCYAFTFIFILILIGVIYAGYFVWDFMRSQYHLIEHPVWNWKWMKKNEPFPIPLPRFASTPFIHFHFRTGWEGENGYSKS